MQLAEKSKQPNTRPALPRVSNLRAPQRIDGHLAVWAQTLTATASKVLVSHVNSLNMDT